MSSSAPSTRAAASTACRSGCACPTRTSARFAVQRFEFPGVDIKTRQTRWYPNGGARRARARLRGRDQRAGPQAHRPRRLRRHLAHRQARRRERLRAAAARHQRLPRDAGQRAGPLGGAPGRLRAEPAHQAAHGGRRPGAVDRPEGAAGGRRRPSADIAARSSRSTRATATCSRSSACPGFDPDALRPRHHARASTARCNDDIDKPLFNRALRGTYPPGSTIKPAHGARRPHLPRGRPGRDASSAPAPSTCRAARTCSARTRTASTATWTSTMPSRSSCDVYFYGLADAARHRPHRRRSSRRSASAASPASTSAARSPGCCPRREWKAKTFKQPADQVWFPGETVNFGIGQGYLLVTPLQLAHYAAIIATRGKIFKPRLVAALPRPADRADASTAPVQRKASVTGRHRRGLGPRRARHDRGHPARHRGRHRRACALHHRRQDRHRAGVHRGAEREVQRQARSTSGCAITPGSSPSRRPMTPRIAVAVLRGERRLRRQRRRADRAQGARCLSARRRSAQPRCRSAGDAMIYEEVTSGSTHAPHAHRRGARAVRAEARRAAAGRAGADRRLRAHRALQRLGPEHAPPCCAPVARLALGTVAMLLLAQVNPNFLRRSTPWLYAVGMRAAARGRRRSATSARARSAGSTSGCSASSPPRS